MRYGENPTKFARHHPEMSQLAVKQAAALSAVTVTFVPHLTGYYREGLDVLRLALRTVRETIGQAFDLMVFDNGSCAEVVGELTAMRDRDEIQWLCLSSQNMKKLGAWNYLFSAAQGDLVHYFDSDILHHPGWLEESKKVLEAFPRAGVVTAVPLPQGRGTEATLAIARQDAETQVEEGQFVSEEWLKEFAESLGTDPEAYLGKKQNVRQVRLTRQGVQAYAFVWHAQFLARGECLRRLFPRPRNWASTATDRGFDELVAEAGYMQLALTEPRVTHLGNSLSAKWREYATSRAVPLTSRPRREIVLPRWLSFLVRKGPIRWLLLRLHAFTFNLIYNVR